MSAFGRFRTLSPKPMLSATVMFGKRAYDWKTIPTLRWVGDVLWMSLPSTVIVPEVGFSKPAIIRSVVVLPQPEGPRNDTNSPFSAGRVKSSTPADALHVKRFWMPWRTRKLIGRLAPWKGWTRTSAGPADLDATASGAAPSRAARARRPRH